MIPMKMMLPTEWIAWRGTIANTMRSGAEASWCESSNHCSTDEHLSSFRRIKKQDDATSAQLKNIQLWFKHHPNAVTPDEQDYIDHTDDLMTMSQRSRSSMHKFCIQIPAVRRLFLREQDTMSTFERGVRLGSEGKVRWFADSIVICLGLAVLYVPMWWLQWVDNDVKKLAIVTCCVFVFAIGMRTLSTRSTPFEVLAGTAAYAAVLMVFMQKST